MFTRMVLPLCTYTSTLCLQNEGMRCQHNCNAIRSCSHRARTPLSAPCPVLTTTSAGLYWTHACILNLRTFSLDSRTSGHLLLATSGAISDLSVRWTACSTACYATSLIYLTIWCFIALCLCCCGAGYSDKLLSQFIATRNTCAHVQTCPSWLKLYKQSTQNATVTLHACSYYTYKAVYGYT